LSSRFGVPPWFDRITPAEALLLIQLVTVAADALPDVLPL
jgi:hypothetical protein